MTDVTATATDFETRLPAAYSQGFAHIRVVSVIDPDSTGPLGVPNPQLPSGMELASTPLLQNAIDAIIAK